ncbi:MAG: urease accessory protein UreE [Leptothrix sp. (in: Bacteria)]|nr:urease accessory protein UreE [Leptothrix sp. (in: b-proteobacteria)]
MLIVNKLIPQARGLAPVLVKRGTTLALGWDLRQKSRFDALDSAGRQLGVFLPRGTVLRGGDALVVEDGSLVIVQAAPQPVMVVRACAEHGSALDLMRATYHLANRHVALEIQADQLKLEPDHVLAEMLQAMHLTVTEELQGFEPEGGAYAAPSHGHGHDHAHAPAPAPRGKPVPVSVAAAPAPHVHGPGCGHDHGHDHGDHKH